MGGKAGGCGKGWRGVGRQGNWSAQVVCSLDGVKGVGRMVCCYCSLKVLVE